MTDTMLSTKEATANVSNKLETSVFWNTKHCMEAKATLSRSLWSPYVIGQTIIFSCCGFFFFFFFFLFFPRLISAVGDCMSTILPHMVWPYVNLECRSEMYCTRLAENTGRKKIAKNRHLGTIAQLCQAISLQLRHVSTIGKKTC